MMNMVISLTTMRTTTTTTPNNTRDKFMKQQLMSQPQMLKVKVPVSQCLEEAIDYLLHSEMGGTEDPTDPWYGTYQSLLELKEKVLDEEEMS